MDEDFRLGDFLGTRKPARLVLIGFPSDEGVRRNGGREGSAAAPALIREALYRMTPDPEVYADFVELLEETEDLGDVGVSGELEKDQELLAEILEPYLAAGVLPIVLGGGHETAYGHFLGYVRAGKDVRVLNWDAHPDVRPLRNGKGHSGSPFRQMLEHDSGRCTGYSVAGLCRHSTAREHIRYLRETESTLHWQDSITANSIPAIFHACGSPLMVSFDLDAVDQSAAPGVSAPAAHGLNSSLWLQAAFEAGRTPGISSVDLVEMNPRFDRDHQTARLAALTVWSFLRGLTELRGRL